MKRSLFLLLSATTLWASGCSERPPGTTAIEAGVPDADEPDADRCFVLCGETAAFCCGAEEECVADRCLAACEGSRCGAEDELCCGAEQLCVGNECVDPGASCRDDLDCPEGQLCEPLLGRCIPIPEDATCRYIPPVGEFDPQLEWAWIPETPVGTQPYGALSHPMVAQLNDDNGNGVIDAADTPDVLFTSQPTVSSPSDVYHRRVQALSGDDGRTLFVTPREYKACGGSAIAVGDVDADGTVEIAALVSTGSGFCGGVPSTPTHLALFDHQGALEWISAEPVGQSSDGTSRQPTVMADLDADGLSEIIAFGNVFSHDGTLRWTNANLQTTHIGWGVAPVIADVDDDGMMELLTATVALNHDGSVLWAGGPIRRAGIALGQILDHPGPQLVVTGQHHHAILDARTGETLLGPLPTGGRGTRVPHPVIADFDGDGRAEAGISSDDIFFVLDPVDIPAAPHQRWTQMTRPNFGSIGVTVFDFDADGSAEAILASYCHVRILNGRTGELLWSVSNRATNSSQFAVVADVDNDGNAELITMSDHAGAAGDNCDGVADLEYEAHPAGIRVWGDALDNWVPTRSVWNQINYSIDNVGDTGEIPARPAQSWTTHNTWRVNRLADPDAITLSPDLTIVALGARLFTCPESATLRARVQNEGARGIPAGVEVTFYAADDPRDRQPVGTALTTAPILPGSGQWVEFRLESPPRDDQGRVYFHAAVDQNEDGDGMHNECNEENNVSAPISVDCRGII